MKRSRFVRLSLAVFSKVQSQTWVFSFKNAAGFATHPLRKANTDGPIKTARYTTYYCFTKNFYVEINCVTAMTCNETLLIIIPNRPI